jgi:CRISPR-associated protein Cas1
MAGTETSDALAVADRDGGASPVNGLPLVPDLVPVRMLNEYAYCARLAYLEWVQGDFTDSSDTIDGRTQHRQVDKPRGELSLDGEEGKRTVKSVEMSAPLLGLIARMDVVEAHGKTAVPVDYKRGKAPDVPEGAWEPERVQVCAQALILEENGYVVPRAEIYFVESRRRVVIELNSALRARTLELLGALRRSVAALAPPPPLVDSPKCPRCSLVPVCLPDELNHLRLRANEVDEDRVVRALLAPLAEQNPLYVQSSTARIGKRGDELVVEEKKGGKVFAKLAFLSHVSLFGAAQISTQAVQELCGRGVPIAYHSSGGWLYGLTVGMTHKNVELRRQQYRTAEDSATSLAIAREIVSSKIRNCRTLLRRNGDEVAAYDLAQMKHLAEQAVDVPSAATLLGIEGNAGRIYFANFPKMLHGATVAAFDMNGRNRRPPTDPVNAMLSLGYALLAKDMAITLLRIGFDPFLGFYHRPRYGRPALALDLMEEFRPLIVDSVVLSCANGNAFDAEDFIRRGIAVGLTPQARARFIAAYERRMEEEVTHPVFGYRLSYRRVLDVQARLLARLLSGEIPSYPGFETR